MHKLFLILILSFSTMVFATDVEDLYRSHLDVPDQTSEQRAIAAPVALEQVILKVVGDRGVLSGVDLSSIGKQADTLIEQYQYQRKNKVSDDLTQPDQLQVMFQFSESRLNSQLSTLGLPIWGKSRPQLLLLFVDAKTLGIVSEHSDNDLSNRVKKMANKRGLPVIFPVMDLQDQQILAAFNGKDMNEQALLAMKQRYDAQIIVFALMDVADNGSMIIQWQIAQQQLDSWQSKGQPTQAVEQGIGDLADTLARQLSQVVSSRSGSEYINIQIDNVKSYNDCKRVMQYFSQLQYIDRLVLSELEHHTMTLSFEFTGDIALLERSLAISSIIRKAEDNVDTTRLYYRLMGY